MLHKHIRAHTHKAVPIYSFIRLINDLFITANQLSLRWLCFLWKSLVLVCLLIYRPTAKNHSIESYTKKTKKKSGTETNGCIEMNGKIQMKLIKLFFQFSQCNQIIYFFLFKFLNNLCVSGIDATVNVYCISNVMLHILGIWNQ